MYSIEHGVTKIKSNIVYWLEGGILQWGTPITIILVGLVSFGLGRFSMLENVRPVVSIVQSPNLEKPVGIYFGGQFVASDTGTVYYYPWCGGALSIPQLKQVWFKNEKEATDAGYNPAHNCKGLTTPSAPDLVGN